MALKLFGHDPSPYVRRTRVLFHELGVPFERDTHGWRDPVAEFLQGSPTGRVPMLDLGQGRPVRYVYDSRVIAEVVYEMPHQRRDGVQPTLWNDALAHQDRNVVTVIDEAVDSGITLMLLEADGIRESAYLTRHADRVRNGLAWLDAAYAGKKTLSNEVLAYADMAVVCGLGWFRFRQRANIDQYPNLVEVERALLTRESFASTTPS